MSFTLLKHFRHCNLVQISKRDLNIINRLCLHCSVVHKQNDDRPETENLVGPRQTLKSISKEDMISKAMKRYMERKMKADAKMDGFNAEYELGRRHLANIMGLDEEEMTQQKVREAIEYLLPSGLYNKRARPKMEPPTYYVGHLKGKEFDHQGRPTHFLYYTMKPIYYELMHNMALKHESFKRQAVTEKTSDEKDIEFEWISFEKFAKMFPSEKLIEEDHKNFLILIKRLFHHPLASQEKDFFEKYQKKIVPFSDRSSIEELRLSKNGRQYTIGIGKRKCARATVRLTSLGSGSVTINGKDITYFKDLVHRQTVLAPLALCGVIDKFDVDAKVNTRAPASGPSADAGAIRLGVARALSPFVHDEMKETLRIAGYLTPDPRMRERKKPGQEGARKKFTWKAR